jgi:hypothetical protein
MSIRKETGELDDPARDLGPQSGFPLKAPRVIAAFLLAPVVSLCLFLPAAWSNPTWFAGWWGVVFKMEVVIGGPLLWSAYRRGDIRTPTAMRAGFVAGAALPTATQLSIIAASGFAFLREPSWPAFVDAGERFLLLGAVFGFFGMIGGAAFAWIAGFPDRRAARQRARERARERGCGASLLQAALLLATGGAIVSSWWSAPGAAGAAMAFAALLLMVRRWA